MRAVVVSENMGAPLDEGIRKFATMLVQGLGSFCEASGICTRAANEPVADGRLRIASGGKLFRSPALQEALRSTEPDVVIYVPSASGTVFSFLRARALKAAVPAAKVAMIATQARSHTTPVRRLLRRLAPDALLCQSQATIEYFKRLGIPARFLPSGVDLEAFGPLSTAGKAVLRQKYGLPQSEFLVLHAGHIKRERNVALLTKLGGMARGVVLASRSMGLDQSVRAELEGRGVIVIDRYLEDPNELYQACDCYLFPVRQADSAMEFPLSVLEAMACNLPVVASPYGGLPLAVEARDGLTFANTDEEMVEAVRLARGMTVNTRRQAKAFGWTNIGRLVLESIGERDAGAITAAV